MQKASRCAAGGSGRWAGAACHRGDAVTQLGRCAWVRRGHRAHLAGRDGGLWGPSAPLFFFLGDFWEHVEGGLTCGMAGRGQQGLGEQRQRREAAGRAGGIAMATRAFGSLCCGARAASGLAVHPDAALDPSFCGLSVPPAPTAILPGEQPWCFVRLGQLLFARVEALSCRAGPAGRKPVS